MLILEEAHLLLQDGRSHLLVQLHRGLPGALLPGTRRRPQPDHHDGLHEERQFPARAEGSLVQEGPGGVEAREIRVDVLVDFRRPQVTAVGSGRV